MKKSILLTLICAMLLSLTACSDGAGSGRQTTGHEQNTGSTPAGGAGDGALPYGVPDDIAIPDGIRIELSDDGITADGKALAENRTDLYTARDIVYYESGHDFTYGEGTEADEHSAGEAAAHTVLHITAPGTYVLTGSLSAGQIAVDLGEGAETDPDAVVNLVLSGVDITCSVAPAIIFYNVYECADRGSAASTVDTTAAGANVFIADGTENEINGSYVARIYKSYELNEAGTEVVDSEKLHKYDAALYSRMSMNVTGNSGRLAINAENEGLDSELHLTINGGVIDIVSGNDGINTNEDGVSVTTVNAGALTITVNGSTGEGDGIDSNGWLVINGGTVHAYACESSGDAGIDSDMGILLNGGEVVATGNMLDAIDGASAQKYALFRINSREGAGATYSLKDANGNELMSVPTANAFSLLLVSSPKLTDGLAALYADSTLIASATPGETDMGGMGGRPGGFGGETGEPPQGGPPEGQPPEGGFPGSGGGTRPEIPDGAAPDGAPGTAPDGRQTGV